MQQARSRPEIPGADCDTGQRQKSGLKYVKETLHYDLVIIADTFTQEQAPS